MRLKFVYFVSTFLQHPMKKIDNKKDKQKIVTVNGSIQCETLNCISYLPGTTSHGGNQLFALYIGLSGFSILVPKALLP
jgi:hypothetical protein